MEMDGGRPVATDLDMVQPWGPAGTAATTSQLWEGQIISSWGKKASIHVILEGGKTIGK